jgi:hypothetical protein
MLPFSSNQTAKVAVAGVVRVDAREAPLQAGGRRQDETPSVESCSTMEQKSHSCETCRLRRLAEAHPASWLARLWRWHTTWCPGWRAYQAYLARASR